MMAAVACAPVGDDGSVETDESAATRAQLDKLLDVNDVSILFPVVRGKVLPDVPMTETLWKQSHFNEVMAEAKKAKITDDVLSGVLTNRALYKAVGFRFDPCAPGLSQTALAASPAGKDNCLIQFRIIVQPFDSSGSDVDVAVHLVYTLGAVPRAQLATNAIITTASSLLIDIKKASAAAGGATAGKALGPHPGLATGNASVVAAVNAFITKMTTLPSSRGIAFMGLDGVPEPWRFIAGTVGNDGKWTVGKVPRLGNATHQDLNFISGNGPDLETDGFARSTSPLLQGTTTLEARNAVFDVENTHLTHFFNAACVSCHTSSSSIIDNRLGDDNFSRRMPVPKGITGYVLNANAQTGGPGVYNTRNFGYFNGKPTVSGRTAAETVEVVDFMNLEVNPAKDKDGSVLHGPGRDCSKLEVAKAVFQCTRDGLAGDCFAKCGPAPTPEGDSPSPPPQAAVCTVKDTFDESTTIRDATGKAISTIKNGTKLALDGTTVTLNSVVRKGIKVSGWVSKASVTSCVAPGATFPNCRMLTGAAPIAIASDSNAAFGTLTKDARVKQLVVDPKDPKLAAGLIKVEIGGSVADSLCK
jgi:hypothetical protein